MAIVNLPQEGEIFEAQGKLFKRQGNYLLGVVGDQRGNTGQFVSIDPNQAAQQLGVQGFKSYNIGDIITPLALQLGGGQASAATTAAVTAGQISISQAKGGFDIGRATLSPAQGLAEAGIDTSKLGAVGQATQAALAGTPIPQKTQQFGQVLTLPSGQRISPQDPNYATFAQQSTIQPTAAQRLTTGIQQPQFAQGVTPQGKSRAEIGQDVLGTLGGKNANQNFVNAVFQAFHGRDATRDELGIYTGQTVDTVRNAIIKGAQAAGIIPGGATGTVSPVSASPGTTPTVIPTPSSIFEGIKVGGFNLEEIEKKLGLPGLRTETLEIQKKLVADTAALKTRYDSLQEELEKRGLSSIAEKIKDYSLDIAAQEKALRGVGKAVQERAAPFKVTASQLERLTALDRSKIAEGLRDLVSIRGSYEQQYQREFDLAKALADAGVEKAQNSLKSLALQLDFAKENRINAEKQLADFIKLVQKDTLSASNISTFTDAGGKVTAVNKATGEVIWTKQIGRSGSATPNISVSPITDPITGTSKYTQIIDKSTGTIKYIDNTTGQEVPASQVQIEEGKEPLDILIDELTGDVLNELNITE